MNVAASLGPLLSTIVIDHFGAWQWCLRLIGSVSIGYTAVLFIVIDDNPPKSNDDINSTTEATPSESFRTKCMRIISCPYSYIISLMFFVSIMTKIVISDWGPLYLIQVCQHS